MSKIEKATLLIWTFAFILIDIATSSIEIRDVEGILRLSVAIVIVGTAVYFLGLVIIIFAKWMDKLY